MDRLTKEETDKLVLMIEDKVGIKYDYNKDELAKAVVHAYHMGKQVIKDEVVKDLDKMLINRKKY
jgi:hypothetical protein